MPISEKKVGKGTSSSTNLGILSHESVIQVIPFIPATLRMRKTNQRE
jgi:hypothetical protein